MILYLDRQYFYKAAYCGYLEIEKDSEEKTIQEPYIVMRKALDKVNRDIVYCVGYGAPNVWNWAPEAGGNQWRTTRDITDEWNVVLRHLRNEPLWFCT